MSNARFAALLGVIAAIGIAGVAEAADGDPLILGQANTAAHQTSLDNELRVGSLTTIAPGGAVNSQLVNAGWVSTLGLICRNVCGRTQFKAGLTQKTISISALNPAEGLPTSDAESASAVVTVIGNHPTIAASARVVLGNGSTTTTKLTIYLSEPAPAGLNVSYIAFDMPSTG